MFVGVFVFQIKYACTSIHIVMFTELFSAAQQGLIGWVKINIGVLLEVTDSIWLIVKTNLNILTSFIGTLLSLFLGGGQAVITFLVNSV